MIQQPITESFNTANMRAATERRREREQHELHHPDEAEQARRELWGLAVRDGRLGPVGFAPGLRA